MSTRATPTNEEMQANLAGMVGPIGQPEQVPVELLAAIRMAMAIEDYDPIHYDAAAAKTRGYRGIVAPWPIVSLLFYNCDHATPPFSFGLATVHGEDSFEFHEPIIVGDVITVSAAVTAATLRAWPVRPARPGHAGTALHQSKRATLRDPADHRDPPVRSGRNRRRPPVRAPGCYRSTFSKNGTMIHQRAFTPDARPPLADLRVVDMSRFYAGNMVSLQLADYGAEVIKIEDPERAIDCVPSR